jgi:hypothetical protein
MGRPSGDLTVILWKGKCDVHTLTNIHDAPVQGNFCDNNGKAIKSQIVANFNRHIGYVDEVDRMANTYYINYRTRRWTEKLLFHLFDLAILSSYAVFSSCRNKKILHRNYPITLLGNLLAQAGQERNVQRPIGRTPAATTQVVGLEEHGRKHWPIPSATQRRHRVCLARGVTRNVSVICQRCDVALCVDKKMLSRLPQQCKNPWNFSGRSTGTPYLKLGPQLEM